jgi:hypothetical protein
MRKMTFKKFFETDWDEKDYELYILKKGKSVLYIGITERGIWNRWFGQRGHMPRNGWGEFFHGSQAGRAVIENFPESWKWTMEVWSLNDCIKFLGIPYNRHFTIHNVEPFMIEHLHPSLNGTYARYHTDTSDLFDTTDQQQEAHRKTFG